MSFENISAENRTFMRIRSQISCSFCRRIGHRITNCNDVRLDNFERMCMDYVDIYGFDQVNFRNFLLDQAINDQNLIKSFAIKKCRVSCRQQIDTCIEKIIDYFRLKITENNISEIMTERQSEEPQQTEGEISNNNIAELNQNSISNTLIHILSNSRERNIYYEYLLFMNAILRMNNVSTENNNKFKIVTKMISIECKDISEENCECNICYETKKKNNFIKFNCAHEFCKDCVEKSLQNEKKSYPRCAFCRSEITSFEIRDLSIKDELSEFIEV
jgi:hypothetical protein